MNKKIRELLAQIASKKNEAKALHKEKKIDDALLVVAEIDELNKELTIEKAIIANEVANLDNNDAFDGIDGEKNIDVDGFGVVGKLFTGKKITANEKALVVNGTNGESALLPEDVKLAINELKRETKSAKQFVNVEITTALSGSTNYAASDDAKLIKFEDGEEMGEVVPKFRKSKWTVEQAGAIVPVGRNLILNEKAGLMAYLKKWFVKSAVNTENADIFIELKNGKTPVPITGIDSIKKILLQTIDPACLLEATVITNQFGLGVLYDEKYPDGRSKLNEKINEPGKYAISGITLEVFSNGQLPSEGDKHPFFIGDTKAGVTFIEHTDLAFAMSSEVMFTKNLNALRIIEQYGLTGTDKNTYEYGEFDSTVAVQAFSSSETPAKLTPKELAKIKADAKIEAKAELEAEAQAKIDAESKV